MSLAECCNFFHIPQLQSNSYIVTCWEGASRGLSAPTKWDSSNTRTPPHASPWSPPSTVRDMERYLGAPGYGRVCKGCGDRNLYSKWTQHDLSSRRVSMCILVISGFFHYSPRRRQWLFACPKKALASIPLFNNFFSLFLDNEQLHIIYDTMNFRSVHHSLIIVLK